MANEKDAAEKTFTLYTDNNSRIKKTFNGDGSATNYWTRSANSSNSTSFMLVVSGGSSGGTNASAYNGVCVGFSV